MLRTLKSSHLLGRLQGFSVTTAAAGGGTSVLTIGSAEASTARVAAGDSTVTFNELPARAGIMVGTPGPLATLGSILYGGAGHVGASCETELVSVLGVAEEGNAQALALSFDTADGMDRCDPKQSVVNSCTSPRLFIGRIAAAGTPVFGGSNLASISKALSVYTVKFANPFSRVPVVLISMVNAAVKSARVTAVTVDGFVVETADPVTAVVEDNDFYFLVFGWDSPDVMSGLRRSVKVPFPLPRIEAFVIDGAGAALDIGGADGVLTDNGVGDYSIAFTEPFGRQPAVFVTGLTSRAQSLASATTTGCQVGAFDDAGGAHAAMDDTLAVIVVGSSDETDY